MKDTTTVTQQAKRQAAQARRDDISNAVAYMMNINSGRLAGMLRLPSQ